MEPHLSGTETSSESEWEELGAIDQAPGVRLVLVQSPPPPPPPPVVMPHTAWCVILITALIVGVRRL